MYSTRKKWKIISIVFIISSSVIYMMNGFTATQCRCRESSSTIPDLPSVETFINSTSTMNVERQQLSLPLNPPPLEIKFPKNPFPVMTVWFTGRIGNLMYQYAALCAISKHCDVMPVIPFDFKLATVFELTAPSLKLAKKGVKTVLKEKSTGKFDPRFRNLNIASLPACRIRGYLQSWKYFQNEADEIRKQFTFRKHIKMAAENFIERSAYNLPLLTSANITTIGIHIRRGDMKSTRSFRFGYVTVPVSYIKNAMDRMTSLYGEKVLFIVASDDIPWCEKNVPRKNANVVFSKAKDPALDLAILSSCDHMIMSTGSFGWWAAWLANGTTIYYKDWPRKNSPLSRQVSHEDYFPPYWIGLSRK
ncbi:galactoside alpha-(1,2)-fucosyltransferase 2-like [Tubulanus polymorphus]|uniref:galactoside alpha-(1,2)-fucosyltransferase 2-like n=1 Tax=Tubulanus polymorphus TaxID=672921 RepID=UPI003DA3C295